MRLELMLWNILARSFDKGLVFWLGEIAFTEDKFVVEEVV